MKKYSRLTPKQRAQVMHCFASGLTASKASTLAGLNRKTVAAWYQLYRASLAKYPALKGVSVLELRKKYFGIHGVSKHYRAEAAFMALYPDLKSRLALLTLLVGSKLP